jgi:hypothetical protein
MMGNVHAMGGGEKKDFNTELAEGTQRAQRKKDKPQEHSPFGFAQGRQE